MSRCWLTAAALAVMLGAVGPPAITAEPKPNPAPSEKAEAKKEPVAPFKLAGPLTFKLEEAPSFGKVEVDGRTIPRYFQGQYARCGNEPSKAVKAYPKFTSPQPLYGELRFDGNMYDAAQGKAVYFVLDQSGEQPKPSTENQKPAAKKTAAKKTDAKKTDAKTVTRIRNLAPAYDRLYVDLNGDGDLTNDGVLKPAEKSPFEGLGRPGQQTFETFSLPVDYGPPTGVKPFPVIASVGYAQPGSGLLFFGPATCRSGKIKVGDQEFVADLTQSQTLSGRYDRPFVWVRLTPLGGTTNTGRLQAGLGGPLGLIRKIDGQWITTSASPAGDQFTIAPYRGDLGVLEVGSGGRAITEMGLTGSLASPAALVTLADSQRPGGAELPRRYELPVGEYLPANLVVQYGRLRFNCRAITDDPSKPPVRSIKIQKDKPCVLSFSGKPAVDFSSPAKDAAFKPGQSVMLRAMLNEPVERLQITGLYDTARKEADPKPPPGAPAVMVAQSPRLDPTIVIRNSSGVQVAEGKMPFG